MDNVLCGHVLSSRKSVPWLYVLPISDILTEVRATIFCQKILLPGQSFDPAGDFFIINASMKRSLNSSSNTTFGDRAETRSTMETNPLIMRQRSRSPHVISRYQPARVKMEDLFRACLGIMYLEKAGSAQLDYSAYEAYCRSTIDSRNIDVLRLVRDSGLNGLDIFDVLQMIRTGLDRQEIVETLQQRIACTPNSARSIGAALDYVARLLVMVDIGDQFVRGFGARLERVVWAHGNLQGTINSHFSGQIDLSDLDVRLERTFTAQNLVKLAGLRISWTADLAAHLLLDEEQKTVYIFHHVTFLECQRKRYAPNTLPPTPFPFPSSLEHTFSKHRNTCLNMS